MDDIMRQFPNAGISYTISIIFWLIIFIMAFVATGNKRDRS